MDKKTTKRFFQECVSKVNVIILWTLVFIFLGCSNHDGKMFERILSSKSGIYFNNKITETDSLNVLSFDHIYNGGGVGVGDFNNDGLQDVFFSGNQVPCKLYLNKGNFEFEDITSKSGIETPFWSTGVAVVDINGDGLLDIYICTISPYRHKSAPNQFFINQGIKNGIPSFAEMAETIGLADRGYSTQAVFFDFDNDGDLDSYILTNALETYDRNLPIGQLKDGYGKSTDRLYRNEGIQKNTMPLFVDVSKEAGITIEGWGLGIGVADFNQDGWQDVYCANDFQSNDLLWINNGNGTFTNRVADILQHQSTNSMGMDVADINNDGLLEIVNLDMMPEDNLRQKMMFSKPAYDRFELDAKNGYQPQFIRNSLQLNMGVTPNGLPVFSDISYMTGVYATDWSWSALLADFDNDGYKDLFVTNGYKKDVTNLDFFSYDAQTEIFNADMKGETKEARLKRMENLLGVKKSNVMFKNQGELNFLNVTKSWGLEIPSYSNGAAYADFDNDGDLDLVINNIDDEAMLYRNNLIEKEIPKSSNFLSIQLIGSKNNPQGFGATLTCYTGNKKQFIQNSPYRGYKSTVDQRLHVGLGEANQIDSLIIVWQDGPTEILKNIHPNTVLRINENNASLVKVKSKKVIQSEIFEETSSRHGINFKHMESDFIDFKFQPLLPHKHSQLGPSIAVGDLNNDKLEDFIVGGAAHQDATLFFQQPDGTFAQVNLEKKTSEDMGVLLVDVDNDGDLDIYCVSGSSEFGQNVQQYQNRLYKNNGNGKFVLDDKSLPQIQSSGSCVIANDFDRDGDIDLFIGGRVSPFNYPSAPLSYLLQNDGTGKFTDVTNEIAPALARIGMVTSALWTDFNNDGWTDLIVVGEFMPITFFKNGQGELRKYQPGGIREEATVGWWNSIVGGDFDNDGDTDYVVGNLGLNSIYQASEKEPVCIYAADFDNNGSIDPILCRFIQGKEYPTHYRESLTDQIAGLRRVLPRYEQFGRMTFDKILNREATRNAIIYKATNFESVFLKNNGLAGFEIKPLPKSAQLAPLFGIQVVDFNDDGNLDIVAVGNDYSPDPLTGQLDACIGVVMEGDGKNNFTSVPLERTGFLVRGDAKAFATITTLKNNIVYLITQNGDSLKVFDTPLTYSKFIEWQSFDVSAELIFQNGTKRKMEYNIGSGYLSQSSSIVPLPDNASSIEIVSSNGIKRIIKF